MSNLCLAGRVFDLLPPALEGGPAGSRPYSSLFGIRLFPDWCSCQIPLADISVRFCHGTSNHDPEPLSYGCNA